METENQNTLNAKDLSRIADTLADISSEIISKMTSLPDSVKNLLLGRSADAAIHYRNQMVQIDRNGIANAWQPNAEDVFADDWQIVTM